MRNKVKFLGGALFSVFVLFFSTVAGATILAPMQTVGPPLGITNENDTLIASAYAQYSTPTIVGVVAEGVYKDASTHSLDFVYQFTQTNVHADVTGFNASDYDNTHVWLTDVYTSQNQPFNNPTCAAAGLAGAALATCVANGGHLFSVVGGGNGHLTPSQASRSGDGPHAPAACQIVSCGGETVDFFAYGNGGAQGESAILIIKTDAPDYTPGSVALIGTGSKVADSSGVGLGTIYNTGKFTNTFLAPTVPEPGFYGVLSIGLAGLFAVRYRRGKKNA